MYEEEQFPFEEVVEEQEDPDVDKLNLYSHCKSQSLQILLPLLRGGSLRWQAGLLGSMDGCGCCNSVFNNGCYSHRVKEALCIHFL